METLQRLSPFLGMVLLLVGTVNSLVMCEALGRRKGVQKVRSFHRVLGWIYVAGLTAFFVYMFPRSTGFGAYTPLAMFHAYTGLALVMLAAAKVLVAGRYKAYSGSLPFLGFSVLVCTFLVIMLTSGQWLAHLLFK